MTVTFNIPDILAMLEKRLAEVLTREQAQMLVVSATADDNARQAQIDADIAYQDAMVAMDHPEMVPVLPAAPKTKAPRKAKPTITTAETAAKPRRRK